MKTIKVKVEGTTPLICNRFTDAAAAASTNGTRKAAIAGNKGTPREQAEPKLYVGNDGGPMIPQPNLMRCIVDGGTFHKAGKKQITTAKSSLLYSCLDISGAEIKLTHREPWRVDTRAVCIPSTGGRILTHRPMFDDWTLEFELNIDDEFIDSKLVRQIVDDAGKRIGLGDFRPAKKGPFGKFVVTQWEAA
jgi:hypothetical protein